MTTSLHDKMLAAIDALFSASDAVEEEVAENLLLDVRDEINKYKLAAESLNEGLRLDDWDKIGCVNHDCDKCKAQQEPVAKPYAYEYGRGNGDGTYSVVIEKGDLVQTAPAVYNYVRPRNAHKDWPIKELFDRPQAQPAREWVGLTEEEKTELKREHYPLPLLLMEATEAKLKEKNT